MPFNFPISGLRSLAETFLWAGVGGSLLGLAGFPAGWLAGSLLFVAVAAFAGRPMRVPLPLARAFFIVIGTTLGGLVTPETVAGMKTWWLSIAALAVAMLTVTTVTSFYLRRVHGWDPLTAFFASLPGALAQVVALASESSADVRAIVVVQTLRVVILTLCVPAGLGLLGYVGIQPPSRGTIADNWPTLLLLIVVSGTAAIILFRMGFPGGLIFGAMMVSGVLHGTGLVQTAMPWPIANAATIGLGAVTGSRFGQTDVRLLLRYLGAAFGSFAVSLAVASVFGVLVTVLLSVKVEDAVVAFAPGAVDAMMILSLALHLDPLYVGAHHVSRVFVVSVSLPLLARWYGYRGKRDTTTRPPRVGADD